MRRSAKPNELWRSCRSTPMLFRAFFRSEASWYCTNLSPWVRSPLDCPALCGISIRWVDLAFLILLYRYNGVLNQRHSMKSFLLVLLLTCAAQAQTAGANVSQKQ